MERLYHLKGRGWAQDQFVALAGAAVLLLFLVGLRKILQNMSLQVGRSEWWTKLPPGGRVFDRGDVA